jgi:hypothetical protein
MNRAPHFRPRHRISSPTHTNAVVLPASLLGYQPRVQELANALPAGTTVLVLGRRHEVILQALTGPDSQRRSVNGRS